MKGPRTSYVREPVLDTPRTQVAALRVRRLIGKAAGPAVATLVETTRSIAVEAAIKVLFPTSM